MSIRTSYPELLAPAGEWDAFVAAVQNGADAVYIGGTSFSARQFAGNFDRDAILRAIDYAHLRGVHVYVTANTLIKDAEVEEAVKYLADLHSAGIDGVIVQDLGLAALARQALPGLPLHASTQMTIHNREGVEMLRDQGFSRVVAARELTLGELEDLCSLGVEIESFVHGALCVCYSGQCLMSSLIGGRSGNRGRCAQPCRLEYTLVDEQGRPIVEVDKVGPHLLSPKDLLGIEHLPELARAGVRSLKIEGRMKRPEYVATVVKVYRTALDRALSDPSAYSVREEEREELEQAFTRGFAPGYLTGNLGRDMMSYQRPSNRGTFLGRVVSHDWERKVTEIKLEAPLNIGDGLEFWVTKGGRAGVVSTQAGNPGQTVRLKADGHPRPGDRVFKTSDARLVAAAEESFKSPKELKAIPLALSLVIRRDQPAVLQLTDEDGHAGRAEGTFRAEPAQKHPLTAEDLRSRLDRFGNTPFAVSEWRFEVEPGLLVPWSELNELRHRAIETLERARIADFASVRGDADNKTGSVQMALRSFSGVPDDRGRRGGPGAVQPKPLLTVKVADHQSLVAAIEAGANRVIFGGEVFWGASVQQGFVTPSAVTEAVRLCRSAGVEAILTFGRILRGAEVASAMRLADQVLTAPANERPSGVLVGNLGLLHLLQAEFAGRTELLADAPLNIFNRATLRFLAGLGVDGATLSPELTLEEARGLAANHMMDTEVMVQGPVTMMVSEYCAPGSALGGRTKADACSRPCRHSRYGLRDRMGFVFPVLTDTSCRMHIQNPKELCLIDHVRTFADAGFSSLRVEAKTRDAQYVAAVVGAYRQALDNPDADLAGLRADIQQLSPQGITKGHFFRGVE